MNLTSNTVLVTGGASGIGLALAARFLNAGNRVVICGRRDDALRAARDRYPRLITHTCDLSSAQSRVALTEWAFNEFPELGALVNNAGIQRRVRLADREDWNETRTELAINLEAPMHLSRLFIPHLLKRPHAAILNVTSGLSFVPLAAVPIYSATKAALHSFTLSLRHQLTGTSIRSEERR